jgi:hypothetical protein
MSVKKYLTFNSISSFRAIFLTIESLSQIILFGVMLLGIKDEICGTAYPLAFTSSSGVADFKIAT